MSNDLRTPGRPAAWLMASLAVGALALSGCDNTQSAGQKVDAAVAKTEQAADTAKAKTEEIASDAKAKVQSSTADASASADDTTITAAVSMGLAKDPDLSATHIKVDTHGGAVSLSGPAPNAAAKARAEEIARSVKGVSSVSNDLEVRAM